MRQHQQTIEISSPGQGLHLITRAIGEVVRASRIQTGIATIFCRHTSCSLLIQENADPSARRDLEAWLQRLAPENDPAYTHIAEGPDDMPAHLRAAMTSTSESIPVTEGRMALGTWQGIYLAEHRRSPHTRSLVVHVMGI